MEPSNEGNLLEVIDLAHTLRQEQLYIENEKSAFTDLSVTLARNSTCVAELAWICSQQRENLKHLIVSRPETGPAKCCKKANNLENTKFLDAYKAKDLKYLHVIAYTELFQYLHRSPYILAQSLSVGDRIPTISGDQMDCVIQTIATGLYGNAIHSKDVEMILKLLRELIDVQIVGNENRRRMLRAGSSAFSRLYYRLHESLFSAKIFLTAALHEPVMKVLIESDVIMDVDFTKNEDGSNRLECANNIDHNSIINSHDKTEQLYNLAKEFIDNLTKNWSLFPSTLRWLVQTMCHLLKKAHIKDKDINEIITDMVFTHFICPAVVSPDIFGISDAPISEQARLNLIQIGRVLQMLALMKYEEVDSKYRELYNKFEVNVISNLLDQLLVSGCDISIGVIAIRSQQNDFERASVLVTQSELIVFTDFLRTVLGNSELIISVEDRQKLSKILDQLPQKIYTSSMNGDSPQHIQSLTESSNRTKQSLLNLGKTTKNKIAKTMSLNIANVLDSEDLLSVISIQQNGACNVSPSHLSSLNNNAAVEETEQVLLFHISLGDESKLQLLTEAEVLKMNCIGQEIADPVVLSEENVEKLDKVDPEFDGIDPVLRPTHTKTTRFSLSHDDASIGNSDNLEAVSEAPSNHSVTSSLEMEENDQNDNLSDMVSANVSGRGTPNISGRDTPSSQVTEGDNPPNQIPTPQMAKIINKARSDIEDKFCKFEIKKLIEGDETISIISDTWSTDVLASDSETLDANERDRNFSTPLIPSSVVLPGDNNFDPLSASRAPGIGSFLDASETRSESAWSTDVFASDSEKLAEVDTDDNLSITAKSDITDAGRSDGDPTREPEIVLQNNVQKAPDSPFFAPRVPNVNFRAPDSPMYGPRPADSTFFAALNYDESSRDSVRSSSSISSLARSSVRTTNQYTGENSFQQNYKSSSERSAFLNAGSSRMRRQNSAESSISNQSLNLEEFGGKTKQTEKQTEFARKFSKDLIDFGGFQEEGAAGIDKKLPVSANEDENFRGLYDGYSEESVIHRRLSSEQRNASFDGRRNGILELKSRESVVTTTNRHVSYENHEIIKKSSTILKTSEASITDDVKNQQNALDGMMLVQKTQELSLNSDNTTEQVMNKQVKSTGAIPKSISFDASADKSERNIHMRRTIDPLRLNGTGFFNKIKQGFKNRRSNKGRPGQEDYPNRSAFMSCGTMDSGDCDLSRSRTNDNGYSEMTEDILAKYRRKVSTSSETTNSDSTGGSCSANRKNSDIEPRVPNGVLPDKAFAFLTAKKKLRAVLSTTDLHTADFCHTTCADASPLLTYLQIQLAQALNLQNLQQISYISEAIRCLNSLEQIQHQKLIEELQADILKRQSYLQYLMRYRQNLLSILANIARFEDLLRNDREMCNRHLIAVCVKMFLEKRQMHIETFQNEFIRLTVVDEKIDLLEEFMNNLITGLKADDILHGVADWQLQEAKTSIERILLQRLYKHVMFPNEDGDIARDEVLHEHIRKLKRVITPCHTALRIPQEYLIEAPWPFAQKQISYISAYKTPQEKLQCIVRCISSITCVLEMACDRSPAADDLLPVLIYVVIQANPPYLLSTIQYVNCFIGDKLHGSDQFSWTQFCSVVQFIKTMDYLD